MAKSIMVSPVKAKAAAKQAEMNVCFQQREEQILKYQSRNPFSYHEWIEAFKSGWLRQHGLNYWSFPAPTTHFRKLWEQSGDLWFKTWRDEARLTQKEFVKNLKKQRR